MTRSVLLFAILPGRRDEFVAGFARLEVLRRASKQPGFRRAQLHVSVDGADEALVTADWDSPEAYRAGSTTPSAPRSRRSSGRCSRRPPSRACTRWSRTSGRARMRHDRRGRTTTLPSAVEQAVRAAVERRRDDLVELARELVRRPSTARRRGPGAGARRGAAARRRVRGRARRPDAEAALADPYAGYPFLSYEGRSSVAGRLAGSGSGSSLHLSGHVDVVPVERADLWEHEPWAAEIADGRIWGRGAGDMKGGLAAYLVAAAAVAEACDDRRGDLRLSLGDRGGVRRQRHVVGARAPATTRTRR